LLKTFGALIWARTVAAVGGMPPLGFDVKNRKLVLNDEETRIVVDIFRRYLALKSVHALRDELADAGIKSKRPAPSMAARGSPVGRFIDPPKPSLPR
jgi:hypothetical protein